MIRYGDITGYDDAEVAEIQDDNKEDSDNEDEQQDV